MDICEFVDFFADVAAPERAAQTMRDSVYEELGRFLIFAADQPMDQEVRKSYSSAVGAIFARMPVHIQYEILPDTAVSLRDKLDVNVLDSVERHIGLVAI
jgi:hypothetical protein